MLAETAVEPLIESLVASFWERPEFRMARPSRAQMVELVRWHVDLVLRWFLDGREPTESEWEQVRELSQMMALAGVPVDTVPANYRLAARYALRTAVASVDGLTVEALVETADLLMQCVDRLSSVFVEAYEESMRATPEAARERAAQALLERICARDELLLRDFQFAEQIGLDLRAIGYAFIVMFPERTLSEHVALARTFRGRGVLAVAQGAEGACVVGVSEQSVDWSQLPHDPEALIAERVIDDRVEVGSALDELRTAMEIAVGCGRRGVIRAEDFLLELLLRSSPAIAERLYRHVYEALSDELVQTVNVLVERDFDRAQTTSSLPVHRNTLRNRIARIREITGVDLESGGGQALARLAWLYHHPGVKNAQLRVVDAVRDDDSPRS